MQMLEDIDSEIRREQAEVYSECLPFSEICGHLSLTHGLFRVKALLDWIDHSLSVLHAGERPAAQLPPIEFLTSELNAPEGEPS